MSLTNLNDFTIPLFMHEIDTLLDNFVYQGYNALANYLYMPLMIISTIFIVLLGYGIMQGWVKMTVGEFSKAMFKVLFIYAFVTNWAFFNEYIVNTIYAFTNGIGNAIISAGLPISMPQIGGIDEALDEAAKTVFLLGKALWKAGGWTGFSFLFEAVFVWVIGSLMVIVAFFEIMLSKVMLAILLMFAPVVIPFAYFKPSSKVVDNWVNLIISMAFLQLFVMVSLALALCLFTWLTGGITISSITYSNISLWGVLAISFVGIVNVFIIIRASKFAYALAGQGSISSGGEIIAGMAGAMFGGLGVSALMARHTARRGRSIASFSTRLATGRVRDGMINKVKSWWK